MNKKAGLWILLLAAILLVAWGVTSFRSQPGPDATDSGTTTSVPTASEPAGNWQTFTSSQYGFSARYPQDWSVANDYALPVPNGVTRGMAFAVAPALTSETNLSKDSALVVEFTTSGNCDAAAFLDNTAEKSSVTENGRTWSVTKGGDAGAGNFYDQTVYAAQFGSRCYGLQLFIHSTNIGNYDPGTVTEFDRAALDTAFAQFRTSFTTN